MFAIGPAITRLDGGGSSEGILDTNGMAVILLMFLGVYVGGVVGALLGYPGRKTWHRVLIGGILLLLSFVALRFLASLD